VDGLIAIGPNEWENSDTCGPAKVQNAMMCSGEPNASAVVAWESPKIMSGGSYDHPNIQ
jgi:hypothetical protein